MNEVEIFLRRACWMFLVIRFENSVHNIVFKLVLDKAIQVFKKKTSFVDDKTKQRKKLN